MALHKLLTIAIPQTLLDQSHWQRLRCLADSVVTASVDAQELSQADGLLVGFGIKVDQAMIDAAPSLKYIGVASTAIDSIDTDYAAQKNIMVTSLPGYATEPVAQFVIAVMLEQASGLQAGRQQRRAGNLSPLAFPARQLHGSNFAVLGLGTIGSRVAQLAQGFGANVAYWSRSRKDESGYQYSELDQLLAQSDFLSVNLPLTSETSGLLNAGRIAELKPGVIMVSVAPMGIVDVDAIAERLAKGDIHATFNQASPQDLDKLGVYPSFIYPPLVYLTPSDHVIMQDLIVENLERFAQKADS